MKKEYRKTVEKGDIVRMPDFLRFKGPLGRVVSWDIVCAGHAKQVWVRPLTNPFYALLLLFTNRCCYEDGGINRLSLVEPTPPDDDDTEIILAYLDCYCDTGWFYEELCKTKEHIVRCMSYFLEYLHPLKTAS